MDLTPWIVFISTGKKAPRNTRKIAGRVGDAEPDDRQRDPRKPAGSGAASGASAPPWLSMTRDQPIACRAPPRARRRWRSPPHTASCSRAPPAATSPSNPACCRRSRRSSPPGRAPPPRRRQQRLRQGSGPREHLPGRHQHQRDDDALGRIRAQRRLGNGRPEARGGCLHDVAPGQGPIPGLGRTGMLKRLRADHNRFFDPATISARCLRKRRNLKIISARQPGAPAMLAPMTDPVPPSRGKRGRRARRRSRPPGRPPSGGRACMSGRWSGCGR